MKSKSVWKTKFQNLYWRFRNKLPDIKRRWLWLKQRREFGCDERDIWSLDITAARWILPRLKFMKAHDIRSNDT